MNKCTVLAFLMAFAAAPPVLADSQIPRSQGEIKLSFAPVVRQTTNHELTLFACHPPGSEAQRYIVRAAEVRD